MNGETQNRALGKGKGQMLGEGGSFHGLRAFKVLSREDFTYQFL